MDTYTYTENRDHFMDNLTLPHGSYVLSYSILLNVVKNPQFFKP